MWKSKATDFTANKNQFSQLWKFEIWKLFTTLVINLGISLITCLIHIFKLWSISHFKEVTFSISLMKTWRKLNKISSYLVLGSLKAVKRFVRFELWMRNSWLQLNNIVSCSYSKTVIWVHWTVLIQNNHNQFTLVLFLALINLIPF